MVKAGLGPIKEKSNIHRSYYLSIQMVELEHSHNYHYDEVMMSTGFIPLIRIQFEDEILDSKMELRQSTKYGLISRKN